jgi:hypothetical protein
VNGRGNTMRDLRRAVLGLAAVAALVGSFAQVSAAADVGRLPAGPDARERREHAPTFRHVERYRREEGLDLDLAGDPAAIAARIRGLIRAWKRGDPFIRHTTSVWGAPLRRADLKIFSYRSRYCGQFGEEVYPWVERHSLAFASFADYYVDTEAGGIIYVGFTTEQDAQVAQLKAELQLIAPGKVRPFPFQPRYTSAELSSLMERITEEPNRRLLSSVGIEARLNKVVVETTHVAKVRAIYLTEFGPEAPIEVTFGRPPVAF